MTVIDKYGQPVIFSGARVVKQTGNWSLLFHQDADGRNPCFLAVQTKHCFQTYQFDSADVAIEWFDNIVRKSHD